MKETTPIYPRKDDLPEDRTAIFDEKRERITSLLSAAKVHGWVDPDWKHGNIGKTREGNVVFLDYDSTGPEIDPDSIQDTALFDIVEQRRRVSMSDLHDRLSAISK